MHKIKSFLRLFVMSIMFSSLSYAADMPEYSADIETTSPKGTYTSRVYFKNGNKRMEMNMRGKESVSITRPDKKLVWMLMPSDKAYLELPFDIKKKDRTSAINDPDLKAEKEFLGNETVEGHPAKKYRLISLRENKKEKSGYIWEATDLNNFIIKYQDENRQHTMVWKNIRTGSISDSLFEIPSGYKKMDMAFPNTGSTRTPKR